VNADGTLTVTGTNTSTGWTNIVDKYYFSGDYAAKVYPAGTYIIPRGLTINVRAAQYPDNVTIPGVSVNL
jgi:hypothetical protein